MQHLICKVTEPNLLNDAIKVKNIMIAFQMWWVGSRRKCKHTSDSLICLHFVDIRIMVSYDTVFLSLYVFQSKSFGYMHKYLESGPLIRFFPPFQLWWWYPWHGRSGYRHHSGVPMGSLWWHGAQRLGQIWHHLKLLPPAFPLLPAPFPSNYVHLGLARHHKAACITPNALSSSYLTQHSTEWMEA